MKGAADRNPSKRSNGEESTYERVGDVSFGMKLARGAVARGLLSVRVYLPWYLVASTCEGVNVNMVFLACGFNDSRSNAH